MVEGRETRLRVMVVPAAIKGETMTWHESVDSRDGRLLHKDARAEELCNTLDSQRTASLEKVKQYADHPRVAVMRDYTEEKNYCSFHQKIIRACN